VLTLALLSPACTGESPGFSSADEGALRTTAAAYVSAWLRDDTSGVLATLDTGAVLLPPGQLPVTGHSAIRAFWWPQDGSRTTIQSFDWTLDEVRGSGDLAYSRGVSSLQWTYRKDTVTSNSTSRSVNLTIYGRGADGRWRILQQMWGPALP
jgi:ketosteroid isomerase-like protein